MVMIKKGDFKSDSKKMWVSERMIIKKNERNDGDW